MADTVTAPSFELGYVNGFSTDWQTWDHDERVPELRWPFANGVYSRMVREDGRVSSVLAAIGLPIRRTPWRVEPNGARDEVVEFVARDLSLPIVGADASVAKERTKGRFSWREHLQTALLMLQYGHSYFEQVYRIGDDGKAHLRKLAPRPQKTISNIVVARDGGLVSIEQWSPAFTTPAELLRVNKPIPVSQLVAYVRDPEPGQWIGNSLLRPAYKHWLLKDELMRIEAATARRNGMGVPVATAPEKATEEDVKRYQKLASGYKGGNFSGVGLPNGADLKLLGVNGNLPDMRQAIEYHDKQIALAGLAHFLNLDRGGSYALASVQADTFVQSVQTFAEVIRDTATAHIVEDLVDINFGENEPSPRIVFDEIGSRQDLTAQSFALLVDKGLIRPDQTLEEFVRQQYGLPDGDPGSAPTSPPPVPVGAQGALF